MDLLSVLSNAQNSNETLRREAEAHLTAAESNQYGPFLIALCQELASEVNPVNVRQLAGLQIKNLINAKDMRLAEEKRQRWVSCDATLKEQARQSFLLALASPHRDIGRVAAQIIANYGAVDVPDGQWPILMDTLFGYVTRQESPETTKVSALEAMGYMCEIMDDEDSVPPAVVNKILGTIVDGMQASRSDPVRLAATQALNNSLYFTEANFASETERNVLVTAMCDATQCRDVNVRKAAYECLGRVAELYYDHLNPYVATIFNLTTTAIRTDSEDVAIPAISFWTSVCESEIDRSERIEEREVPTPLMLNLIETAAQPLTACLLEAMTKQPEEVDEDEWNLNEAASECLEEVAANIKKNVIPHVLPFIQQHITSPEWNLRDAAVSAFGHILGGPDASSTKAIVEMGIATILQLTQDPHERVRWSAVWTLGKICETHKECTDPAIKSIIPAFMASLQDKNIFIVAKACYGISNLALACQQDEDDTNGNILSPFYYNLVEKLLAVAARPSTDDGNFRSIAYETINGLVENSSKMEIQVNKAILSESVNRLESTWHAAATMDAKDRHDMQSSICTLISQVLKKLNRVDLPVAPDGDRIMGLLLGILSEKGIAGNDDAAFAVGAMADLMEDDFVRYINHLRPMLLRGLSVTDDYSTCIISVGLLGDICRAVKGKVCAAETGFCDDYVLCLINLCQSNTIDRSVKTDVISFFADLAMAIEGDFERYIPPVLPILVSAGMIVVENSMDEDTIDYINQLRAGILEAYTGILQGLHSANKQDNVGPHLGPVADFLHRVAADDSITDDVLKNLVGLMGDLAKVYGAKVGQLMSNQFLVKAVHNALQCEESEVRETAQWALSELKKVAPQTYGS